MKHHFADFLDRQANYWTIVPNKERYAYSADKEILDKDSVKVITISKQDKYWEQIFDLKNLEELTLHDASKEQVEAVTKLEKLTRLRITHLRSKNIDFITNFQNLEELVLEYVSGFSDLKPLSNLKKLKSLHLENLRRVRNFDGLRGLDSLQYLHIDGTVDWNQPIESFEFLESLPNLEVFSLGFITNKTEFPAFLPILGLKKLKKIKIGRATLKTNEYAFLQTAFPNIEGLNWELCWEYENWIEFLGKGAGRVKCNNPNINEKYQEFIQKFAEMKKESESIIRNFSSK